MSPYEEVNSFLHKLHTEKQERRTSYSAVMDDCPTPFRIECDSVGSTVSAVVEEAANSTTRFCISDVVQCEHGACGRCLKCAGRLVQNVPLPVFTSFCRAYAGAPQLWGRPAAQRCTMSSSSTARPSVSPPPAWQAVELNFPALVSLAAGLAPEPGERLLHLGSGAGQVVLAWALVFPQGAASGVEGCLALHRAANRAAAKLRPEEQRRVHLHHCDPFGVQGDWDQASVVVVSAAGFDETAMGRVLEGLQDV